MSAIQKDDIITSEALKVIPQLTEDLAKASEQLAKLIVNTKALSQSIAGSSSIPKVKEDTEKLTQAQIELDKIQKQLTVSVAKNNEDYIAAKRVLNDLNQVINQKTILGNKDAKAIDAQTASLRQLETALQKNRKAYADLKGDQERNGKSGQDLKKVILEQAESVDKLRSAMGQHKAEVSDYREGLEGLLVTQEAMGLETGGLISSIRNLGKAFFALLANPIFLTFATLAAIFGAAKSSVETFFETTEEGEKIAEHQAAIWDAFGYTVKKAWGEAGKATIDAVGGEDGMKGIIFAALSQISIKWGVTFLEMADKGTKFADVVHEINEKLSKDIVTKAKSELEFDKLILQSKDKVANSDEERLSLMDAAIANRKKQSDIEKALAKEQYEVTIKQIALEKNSTAELVAGAMKEDSIQKQVQLTLEQKNRINEAEANIYKKETDILNEQKRLYAQRATEAIAIDTARLERLRAQQDSEQSLNKSELEAQLKINEDTVKSVFSTQEEITNAIYQASITRQNILAEDAKKQDIDAIRAAEDRVRATGKYKQEEIDTIVAGDKTLVAIRTKIQTDFESSIRESDKKLQLDLNANQLSKLKKDYDNIVAQEKTDTNKKLLELDEAYYRGGVGGLITYEKQKKEITDESNRRIDIAGSDFLKKQLDDLKLSKEQEAAIIEAISKHELNIKQLDVDKQIALDKKLFDYEKNLEASAFAASMTIIQNIADSKAAAIDKELADFQELTKKKIDGLGTVASTDIAGTKRLQDEKDKINAQAAVREKQLADEKAKLLHRAAIYEKALALTQIIINTEQAASKAYAEGGPYLGPVFAALAVAAGAFQFATAATKPIPQYEKGTMSSEGGTAIVGEKGSELVITPRGQLQFTPSTASLINLEAGSKVYTHEETLGILARGELQNKQVIVLKEDSAVNEMMINRMDILINATKQNKNVLNMVTIGSMVWDVREETESRVKMARRFALGKWVK